MLVLHQNLDWSLEKSVRTWRNKNGGEFSESCKGKHVRPYVLQDEECKGKALSWLHEHAYAKGEPVLTSARFAQWVNSYREGRCGSKDVESAIKLHKSQCRVPETESV